ncbi:MAG: hypothetical protein JSW68_05610 [Burkholderiales bacterium]|nr:MAG: hypothetical protein JSW68_05610 [Burkholderiales bacterium]
MSSTARSAHDWLRLDSTVEDLIQSQRRLLELQALLDNRFPHLALRATRLAPQAVTLLAPSAAAAAKARQSIPRLIDALQQAGWQISRIKIRPQREHFGAQAPVFKVKPELSSVAVDALRHFGATVNDQALANAIHRMIERHRQRGWPED